MSSNYFLSRSQMGSLSGFLLHSAKTWRHSRRSLKESTSHMPLPPPPYSGKAIPLRMISLCSLSTLPVTKVSSLTSLLPLLTEGKMERCVCTRVLFYMYMYVHVYCIPLLLCAIEYTCVFVGVCVCINATVENQHCPSCTKTTHLRHVSAS